MICCALLVGCQATDSPSETEIEADFIGIIENINGDQALVAIEEGSILTSGNQVMVDLSVAEKENFRTGDRIKVGYDGLVREYMPHGVNTLEVEKLDGERYAK